jgi:hypothetical protein
MNAMEDAMDANAAASFPFSDAEFKGFIVPFHDPLAACAMTVALQNGQEGRFPGRIGSA